MAAGSGEQGGWVRRLLGFGGMVATLVLLVVFFSLYTENFFSLSNLRTPPLFGETCRGTRMQPAKVNAVAH